MERLVGFMKGIDALYAYPIGVAIIIIGAAVALKAGNKWGWAILGGGIFWIILKMKAQGLI